MKRFCRLLLIAIAISLLNAQGPPASPTIPKLPNADPHLLQLVIEDQWDRGIDMFGKGAVRPAGSIDSSAVAQHDAARQATARELLAAGRVASADDFRFASLIFQHSFHPDDLMLAHILITTSVSKGGTGKWLMAATMDRYLQSIKQPQIFGTQFRTTDGRNWTMDPYNRTVVSDAERALWCVVPLDRQTAILGDYQSGKTRASTALDGCK